MPLFPQGGGLYPNNIDNVLLADMAQATVKGRAVGAGTGDPQDLTQAQLQAMVGSPLSFRNILGRNGGFEVWQRGAGGSAAFTFPAGGGGYSADGWYVNSTIATGALQTGGLATGSRYSALVYRQIGQPAAGISCEFPLDSDEILFMRGQIVTLSFSVMADTAFSPVGGVVSANLLVGTGTPKRASAGFTGQVAVINASAAATTTAARYAFTSAAVVPANATQASVYFAWNTVGTGVSGDAVLFDDAQLEVGSIATPFERRFFESELLACQRHYEKTFNYNIAPAQATGSFLGCVRTDHNSSATINVGGIYQYAVRKRVVPVVTFCNPTQANNSFRNQFDSSDIAMTVGALGERSLTFESNTAPALGNYALGHIVVDAGI